MYQSPLTRRGLIERLGLIGGAGLMMAGMQAFGYGIASAQTAPPALPGSGGGKKILILGGGLAGLTSAYELSQAGYEVQVIEARKFAGGRSQTARRGVTITELGGDPQTCDFDDGLYINHGPWRIPYHHYSTLHYTKAFGVPLEVFVNDNDASYLFFEKGSGPLKAKAVRKAKVAADARGHAAEMLAKLARKGGLDDQIGADDRDQLIAYLVGEGYLSPKTSATPERRDAAGTWIPARCWIQVRASRRRPTAWSTCCTPAPGGCSPAFPAGTSSGPCSSRSAAWIRSPRRSRRGSAGSSATTRWSRRCARTTPA